ncbi:MAG: hypothetical protein AAF196_12385 [Planctomycetota bacterium]
MAPSLALLPEIAELRNGREPCLFMYWLDGRAIAWALTCLLVSGLMTLVAGLTIFIHGTESVSRSRSVTERLYPISGAIFASLCLGVLVALWLAGLIHDPEQPREAPIEPQKFDEVDRTHWQAMADGSQPLVDRLRALAAEDRIPTSIEELPPVADPSLHLWLAEHLEIRIATESGFCGNRWILRASAGPTQEDLWIYYPNGRYPESGSSERILIGGWAYYNR